MVPVPVGSADAPDRVLRAPPAARAGPLPDHRDLDRGPGPHRRRVVREPTAKVYGYATSLVVIDVGMVFIAALFVIAGRPLWREERDSTYLALALGFSGIPVWGLLEVFCLNGVLFSLIPTLCDVRPGASWLLGLWFVAVPAVSVLLSFRRFLLRGSLGTTRAG